MNVNDHDRTSTDLERAADAAVGTLVAWVYPSDLLARQTAQHSCALIGMDYIDVVSRVMESTNADADTARFMVASSLMSSLGSLVGQGHAPRRGIAIGGYGVDSLGRSMHHAGSDDDD